MSPSLLVKLGTLCRFACFLLPTICAAILLTHGKQANLQIPSSAAGNRERQLKRALIRSVARKGTCIPAARWLRPHVNVPLGKCPDRVCGIQYQDLEFFSQIRQDHKILHDFFCEGGGEQFCGKDRVVVDIGANDGISGSNSLFFEKSLGWSSFCVEGGKEMFQLLEKNRPKCIKVNSALGEVAGEMPFLSSGPVGGLVETLDSHFFSNMLASTGKEDAFIDLLRFVNVTKTSDLFKKHGLHRIDLLSIDVEGAELSILKGIEWEDIDVRVITIEANTHTPCQNSQVRDFLEMKANMRLYRKWKYEEVYVKKLGSKA